MYHFIYFSILRILDVFIHRISVSADRLYSITSKGNEKDEGFEIFIVLINIVIRIFIRGL